MYIYRPLKHLARDLELYGQRLNKQLVDLLNRDYADLISLSSSLVGTRESIQTINTHLNGLRSRAESVEEHVQQAFRDMEEKLQEQSYNKTKLRQLENLYQIHLLSNQLNQLLKSYRPLSTSSSSSATISLTSDNISSSSSSDLNSLSLEAYERLLAEACEEPESQLLLKNAWLMERMARLQARLLPLLAHAKDLDLYHEWSVQTEQQLERFRSQLAATLLLALEQQHELAMSYCLRAFAFSGLHTFAEDTVREQVLRPELARMLSSDRLRSATLAVGSAVATEGLGAVFQQVLQLVRRKVGLLLSLVGEHSPFSFDFLGRSVWQEVAGLLSEQGSLLFAVGQPELFHTNYSACIVFLSQLEALTTSPAEIERFRSSNITRGFLQKWNLQVYFKLREQHIRSRLHQHTSQQVSQCHSLTQQGSESEVKSSEGWLLSTTGTLWQCVKSCWAPQVWLAELTVPLLTLSLQLVTRYLAWVADHSGGSDSSETSSSSTTTAQAAASNLSVSSLVALLGDLSALQTRLPELLPHLVETRTAWPLDSPNPLRPQILAALAPSLKRAQQLMTNIHKMLARALAGPCLGVLASSVPRIQQTYRMTNKPTPVTPSAYVAAILNTLHNFLSETTALEGRSARSAGLATLLATETVEALKRACLERVTVGYLRSVREMLEVVSRADAALERLASSQRKLGSATSVKNKERDSDKIRIQLHLDIQQYSQQLESLGLVECHGLKELQDLTKL